MNSLYTIGLLFGQAGAAGENEPATDGAVATGLQAVEGAKDSVLDTFADAFNPIIAMAPKALAAVVILVIGYAVAKLLGRLAATLCETIGLQTAAERSGLAASMSDVGIKRGVPAIIGLIVFWLLMCVSIMASFKVLGLAAVSDAMQEVVNYIPNLLIATVVIVIGLLVANFTRGIVATSGDRVGISYAEQLAGGCYYVLALMTFITAFQQLGIKFALLEQLILIAFGALAVGFALAFGLGGRDVMGGILSGYYVRQRFQAGDHVRLGEMEGTVREVGPVATVVETEEAGLMHRHSVPNSMMLKEAVR